MDCKNSRDDSLRTVTLRVDILQQGKELNQTLLKQCQESFQSLSQLVDTFFRLVGRLTEVITPSVFLNLH